MSETSAETNGRGGLKQARHTVGVDLGTSNLRLQIAHFDALGRPAGEPAAVHLPHSERDGMLPTVLHLSPAGELLAFGRAAVQRLPHTFAAEEAKAGRFVAEFKPCIGQAPEDLTAQGRPEKARLCTNPACPRPGWAWSLSLQFCGFCGAPLAEAAERWQPQFPYPADEAREFARLLLSEVRQHLERRLNEPLRKQNGWEVVAGVPVHWQAGTRASYHQVLAQAFPEAGITLLSEPEGALRYYGCQGLIRAGEGWTLVVDFGAGTTDLVLGRVFSRGGEPMLGEVRAYGERYGGADFDLLLARHAAAELGVELNPVLLSRWKLEAQRWKEAFSDAAQFDPVAETGFSFPVPTGDRGCDFRSVVIDRATFHRVAGELVERFRSVLERGLRHFNAGPREITQVVLTGGGAQWYFVEAAVRELCPGAHIVGGVEPVRAIARGLALAPALLQLLETPRAGERPSQEERSGPEQPHPEPATLEPQDATATEPAEAPDAPDEEEVQVANTEAAEEPKLDGGEGEASKPKPDEPILKTEPKVPVKPNGGPRESPSGGWFGLFLVCLFLWNVWPTPYTEYRVNGVVVPDKRVHRITRKVQVRLNGKIWVDESKYDNLRFNDPSNPSNSPFPPRIDLSPAIPVPDGNYPWNSSGNTPGGGLTGGNTPGIGTTGTRSRWLTTPIGNTPGGGFTGGNLPGSGISGNNFRWLKTPIGNTPGSPGGNTPP